MLTKEGLPDYRTYNCNLQAPKVYCNELTVGTLNFQNNGGSQIQLQPSQIYQNQGYFGIGKTFTITSTFIPVFGNTTFSGTLTCYFQDPVTNSSDVALLVIAKNAGSANITALIYQQYGNIGTVTVSATTATQVTLTILVSCECRWIFQGF